MSNPVIAPVRAATSPKRYYDDQGHLHPDLNLADLKAQLHALYTRWVAGGCFRRDFAQAVDHTTSLLLLDHALAGLPNLCGQSFEVRGLPLAPYVPQAKGTHRLYDEYGLNPAVNLDDFAPALRPLFLKWVAQGWHFREFPLAARECAVNIVYDHEIALSLEDEAGSEEFLTRVYLDTST